MQGTNAPAKAWSPEEEKEIDFDRGISIMIVEDGQYEEIYTSGRSGFTGDGAGIYGGLYEASDRDDPVSQRQ